jgi:hypothetical protein
LNNANATNEEILTAYNALMSAIHRLEPVAVNWRAAPLDEAFMPEQRDGNIAFLGGRTASHVTGDARIWAINNNAGQEWRTNNLGAANAWGTWNTGGFTHPTRGGPTGTAAGSWNWLEYSWPSGARVDSTIVYHWRDGGGINRPTGLSVMYLPLYSDEWREAHFVPTAQLTTNTIGNNRVGVTNITFTQPLEARAIRVWFSRLANGEAPGVAEWQVFGSLTTMQNPPGPFEVTHNTTLDGQAGAIAGVTSAMEWRFGSDGAWTAVAEGATALTNLQNGNFYIRYRAHERFSPSPAVRVGVRLLRTDAPTGLGSEPATAGASDGVITGVEPSMEFADNANGPWLRVTGITIPNVAAGTWYVRYAETTTSSVSPAATIVVGTWDGERVPHDPPTGLIVNPPGAPGESDGSIMNVTGAMEWRAAGQTDWITVVGTRISNLAAGSYHVRVAETPRNLASAHVVVVVPDGEKGGQAPPVGLIGIAPSVNGGSDGQIIGVRETMEWRAVGQAEWTPVVGNVITDLTSGTYQVRVAETPRNNPSPAVDVVVPEAPTNKDYLSDAIADAELLGQGDFTAANWRLFNTARNHARSVYNDPDATQVEINSATNTLRNLINRQTSGR